MKKITGYNYMITKEGKVYANTRTQDFIKGHLDPLGYLVVKLHRKEYTKQKSFRIHRLVAQAFIPNPYNYKTVIHINGDRTDNRVENLKWSKHREKRRVNE